MSKELVSVVIPTYNRYHYLQQAIESIINQNNNNIELIIVNDGSTDQTEAILQSYQNKYSFIKAVNQENQGVCVARNTGITDSSGEFIIFLDDDDLLVFNGVEKLYSEIKKSPENVKIVCGNLIIDYEETNKRMGRLPVKVKKNELLLQFLIRNQISVGQVIINRAAIIEKGGFSINYPYSEDYDLWTRMLLDYDIAYLNHPVLQHRKHPDQVTAKQRGLVRYYSDKVAYKLLNRVNLHQLIKPQVSKQDQEGLAAGMESFALIMLNYPWTHFDTALEILKIAQNEFFTEERQLIIGKIEESIPYILENKFKSNLRLSSSDKLQ
jgi:glycosyltransferase involved in cell wall biosynthesis